MTRVIDGDTHLYEPRSMWRDHIDPSERDLALSIDEDELGYAWLTWKGRRLHEAEVQTPGQIAELGELRSRRRAGEPAAASYDELLPAAYTEPEARIALLDEHGVDACCVFPNHGLLWERQLAEDRVAVRANMRAHNRWMAEVVGAGGGRLVGVGHLELSDPAWVEGELARLAAAGVKLAMVAPAPVAGRSLAHPAHDPMWESFVRHDVAVVFHVGAHPRPLHPDWYDLERDPVNTFTDSVLLSSAPAVALTNMAVFGVFERHPGLRVGIVELSAWWYPMFLLMLDGAVGFVTALHGEPPTRLRLSPSDYLRRQVRVGALAYEQVIDLVGQVGEDTFMFGSDWPHAEGIADPLAGYRAANPGIKGRAADKLYGDNFAWLANL